MVVIRQPETRMLHSLLRLHGRDPAGFDACLLPDRTIRITGPHGAAFYPAAGWTSRFLRHLRQGWFDAAPVPAQRAAA